MSASRQVGSRRAGFTLVELLVVIGIIALLISILLPALSKARESAKMTGCLAGLRSFGQLLNVYANDFKGRVPLGYSSNKYSGYMIYNGGLQVMGIMYDAGYFKNGGQAYFCPSKQDPRWQFDTAENPWKVRSGAVSRLGMTMRPAVKFVGMVPGGFVSPATGVANSTVSTLDLAEFRGKFPLISSFKNKAIASEMFGEPWNTSGSELAVDPQILSHKNYINTYFADNSAIAVNVKGDPTDPQSFEALMKRLADLKASPTGQAAADIYLDETVTPNKGVWTLLDKGK